MAATVTSNQHESLPQPSSPPTSPALYSSFNQPPRTPSSNMYSARSQGSLPGTPTTSTYSGSIFDVPPGANYADFLRTWSDTHVSTWLTNIKCGHHSATFRASDIRGDVLLELDQVTLKEIGVVSVGDRLRILNAVKNLRQRCSSRGERASTPSPTSRSAARRHEHGRPPPLQLGSSTNPQPNLPHIIRDGANNSDSFRPNAVRPLPHPVASSSSTPVANTGSSQSSSSRAPHLPLPPVPRGHPPPPPPPPAPPSGRPTNRNLLGRKTPTQFDAPEFTSQPLPPAPALLTPQSAGSWSGYGLPPDPKAGIAGAKSPNRFTAVPTPPKPTQRPAGPTHPYAQGVQPSPQTALSPIAESFSPQHTPIQANAPSSSSSPPTSFAVGRGPFANASLNATPFPYEGHSATINVEDCAGGVEVLEKVLKKFGKLSARNTEAEGPDRVGTSDGGLSVDGWCVYLDWGNDASLVRPLTEAQLLSVCHAPPNDPAREHGLTLRRIAKAKRPKPIVYAASTSNGHEDDNLPSTDNTGLTPKRMKRASTVSVLSGLGVEDPERVLESPSSPTPPDSGGKGPTGFLKGRVKARNFFGQRPPSELITNHLTEYFPFTEKKVLERTARHSMLRAGGSIGRRDSTISFNPRSSSRFSISTVNSRKPSSLRGSVYSLATTGLEVSNQHIEIESSGTEPTEDPPRVSLSTDDGSSLLESEDENPPSQAHLLPPVDLESFTESMSNLAAQSLDRRLSTSSSMKRMSYITELRSKRDVSDSASFITVDEITAEVESRRENGDEDNGWTAINAVGDEERAPPPPEDVPVESVGEDGEDELDEDMSDVGDEDEDDETGRAIASGGIKWIKGALIGAGSFGKVYLGMDATNGLLMAVKQVEVPTGASDERKKTMTDALEREIELLKDLQHENIVQYLYSSSDDEFFNIFLEYVPGGSVAALLRNYGAFEEPLVRNFVRQILEGLHYVHERGIVHRDIKGANVLVDNKGGIKISDFGISKKLEDNLLPGNRLHRPSLQGSVFWMAPEVVKQVAYTKKADIWSVGCLIVEMLTGEHPWAQLNQMQAIFKIGSSGAKPPIPSDISADAQNCLDFCFELDHEIRPSAGDLLGHAWLKKKANTKGQKTKDTPS
ncbi:Pkinase-domain-containing protein [Lactarius deliciosus]|nr:Pkinase-domain-containing protein [Lactarius deliciosus]